MPGKSEWYDAYPKPRNHFPATVSRQNLLERLQQGGKPGIDFLLIDLRRTDHEVSFVCISCVSATKLMS